MFRLFLAVILLIVAVVLYLIKQIQDGNDTYNVRKWATIPFALALLFGVWSSVRVVDAGEVGVPVLFGSVQEQVGAGVKLVNPLSSMNTFSVRSEEWTFGEGDKAQDGPVSVKGSDGASGVVSGTALIRLDGSKASDVFQELGTNYEDKVIRPTVRTCTRDSFAANTMVDNATSERGSVDTAIAECIENGISRYGLILEDFQLRDIEVSQKVQESIDRKVEAQQNSEARLFDLEAARTAADIKREEAKATADAEQIIVCGAKTTVDDDGNILVVPKEGAECENNLTPEYLELQRIQALERFAENGNSIITDSGVSPIVQTPVRTPQG